MVPSAATALAFLPLVQDKPLSKVDASELRKLYAEALADSSRKATRKLLAFGKKLEKKTRGADLFEALRPQTIGA